MDINNEKYYTYFITDAKPILMNDIKDIFIRKYGNEDGKNIAKIVESNIHTNEWENVIGDNITGNLKSLVLVKFTNVNDMFIRNSNSNSNINGTTNNNNGYSNLFNKKNKKHNHDTHNNQDNQDNQDNKDRIEDETDSRDGKFTLLLSSDTYFSYKYNNGDNSFYKLRNTTFSGTQNPNYFITPELNYIYVEKIFIPIRDLLQCYHTIEYDSVDRNTNRFDTTLNECIRNGIITADNNSIDILKLFNAIIKDIPNKNSNTWSIMRDFIPLLDNAYTDNVKILWDKLMIHHHQNPLKFLSTHKLITNSSFTIRFNPLKVEHCDVNCSSNAKLYITEKIWNDICYKDALPYKACFITKENTYTSMESRHNVIVNKIENHNTSISNMQRQINYAGTTNEKKANLTKQIENNKKEIGRLEHLLTPIDEFYKNHILHQTQIGVRTIYSDYINSYKAVIYLRPILTNYNKLKDKFRFKYDIVNRSVDNFKLYIEKELLKEIITLNIKIDLFSASRLFPFKMEDRFDDKNYMITNYKYNSDNDIISNSQSIKRLDTFLQNNLSVDLIRHQKSNILWMLKLEDQIDDDKLTVESMEYDLNIRVDSIYDIRKYIYSLKTYIPESFIKHCVINYKGQKYILQLKKDDTIANTIGIASLLNYENIKHYGSNLQSHFNFDSDIIENITTFEEYKKTKTVNVPLCGGAICDEVGLGKTLSVISHLILKMKNDMLKYSRYKSALSELMGILYEDNTAEFKDPLDMGFEYNNLIIVPSRLTSQWETEIEKYCKDKFKLRVKVLVGISSIINLERELHDFYEKMDKGMVDDVEGYRNLNKKYKKNQPTSQQATFQSTINKNDKYETVKTTNDAISTDKEKKVNKELEDDDEIILNTVPVISKNNLHKITKKELDARKALDEKFTRIIKETDEEYDISQSPIIKIEKFQNFDITVNETSEKSTEKQLSKQLSKQHIKELKMIEKLMSAAKKNTIKTNKTNKTKKNITSNDLLNNVQNSIENTKVNIKAGNTLENILNCKLVVDDSRSNTNNNSINPILINSDVINSDVINSDVINSDVINSDVINSDVINSDTNLDVNMNNDMNVKIDSECNDKDDPYRYVLPYLDCDDETGDEYRKDQLYDIYIISVNLLTNDNYLEYVNHNENNHLRTFSDSSSIGNGHVQLVNRILDSFNGFRKICRATNKFNIFRIKWNRVILDEAHEKLLPIVKYFSSSLKNFINNSHKINYEDQFLFENLVALRSNYKWAMTGTPSQHGIDNIMGILQFLSKKHNNNNNNDKMIAQCRYFSNLLGVSSANLNKCLGTIFKKTSKKDIKNLLNIPIFTEEIIYVDQNNIERNIYNTIRASRHFTEAVKLKRLFLMCTNILINEGYDFDGEHDISTTTEILTLEQLNANMISKFTEQLKLILKQETKLLNENEISNKRQALWQSIIDYITTLELDTKLGETILNELKYYFGNLEKSSNRSNVELVYNMLEIFSAYQDPTSAGMVIYCNYQSIKEELQKFWKTTWENENTMTWMAQQGAQIGVIKCLDEVSRNNKRMESINTEKKRLNNQISLFSNNEFLKEKTTDPCIICFEDLKDLVVTPCRHVFCLNCTKQLSNNLNQKFSCPECRTPITCNTLNITTVDIINGSNVSKCNMNENDTTKHTANINVGIVPVSKLETAFGKEWKSTCTNKYGSKMAQLVEYLHTLFDANPQNRIIIFSQYDKMLKMIGKTLDEYRVKYVYCHGNNYVLNKNINRFKKDDSIRVIMLSSETSNSGSNLTEANYIIFIDVLFHNLEHVKATEAQAIGRAVRLGQKLPVKVVRFITRGTIEEEHYRKNQYDMNILQE